RSVLHAVGLRHHRPAARALSQDGEPWPGAVLAAAGATPAARAVPHARGGERAGGALRHVAARRGAPAGDLGRLLLRELVDDRRARHLLLSLRLAAPARPSLVALDRG